MWPIVRDAIAGASPGLRSQIRWIALFWMLMVALQIWDSRNAHGAAGVAEFLSAVLGSSGMALLGLAHTLNLSMREASGRRRLSNEAGAVEQVLLALPALGFTAGVALGGAALLIGLRAMLGMELPLAVILLCLYFAMMLFAGRTVTQSARTLFQHASTHAAAAARARGEASAAQFAALQARLNPHFLFNALNTVAALLRSNPPAAEAVVEDLADVLRRTIDRSTAATGTVQEELDYVRSYLALEQARWQDQLQVTWDIDESALDRPLLPLALQPLVENALRHGLGGRADGGRIRIAIRATESATIVAVEDDGVGFPRHWREGTGLGDLRQRLQTLYADGAALKAGNTTAGATVTVTVPARG